MAVLYLWLSYSLEKFLFRQIKCMVDQTQNPIVYYGLKTDATPASDNAAP